MCTSEELELSLLFMSRLLVLVLGLIYCDVKFL